jgi:hypothetical protein
MTKTGSFTVWDPLTFGFGISFGFGDWDLVIYAAGRLAVGRSVL